VNGDLVFVDQIFLREIGNDGAAAEDGHARPIGGFHLADFCRDVAFDDARVAPGCFVHAPREDDFRQLVHLLGHDWIILAGHGRRPIAGHEVVGLAPEEELSAATGIALHKFKPFRIVLVRPAHIAVGVSEVAVKGDVVKDDEFAHR